MAGRTDLEQLVFTLSANITQMQSQLKRAQGDTKKAAGNINREMSRLGADVGRSLARMSGYAQLALGGLLAYSLKLASDADEVRNAFNVAFNKSAADAEAFAKKLSRTLGRDVIEVQEGMSRLQLVITGMGVEAAKSAELVKMLTERAVDVGSLFNVSDQEALQAFISGISGEAEPLKKFGVVLTEAAVKAELLRLGFKGNAQQASEAAKAIARTNIIMAKTAVAQGDAARTAGGAANQAKAMRSAFNDAARDLGQQLLPAATAAMKEMTKLLGTFRDMPSGMQMASLAILAFVAAGGPIAALLTNLGKVIRLAGMAQAALLGMTGAGAAAGGGSAAAAGGLGVVAAPLTVAAVGGYGFAVHAGKSKTYNQAVKNPKAASDEDLLAAIAYGQANFGAYARENSKVATAQAAKAKFQSELGKLRAEQNRRMLAAPAGGGNAPFTPFALTEDMLTPATGTSGGGRGGSGASVRTEADLKAARERLALEQAIAEAQAGGDQRRIDALQGEQFILDRIAQYKAAGLSTAEAETAAILDRLNILKAQDQADSLAKAMEAVKVDANPQLVNLLGDPVAALNAQADELKAKYTDIIGGAFQAARYGGINGFLDYFAQRLGDKATNALVDALATAAASSGSGGSNGGFNWGSLIAGGLKFFAEPGTLGPGELGVAGEAGPELFRAKPGGGVEFGGANRVRMLGSIPTAPAGSGRGGTVIYQTVHADRSILADDVFRRINSSALAAAQAGATMGAARAGRIIPAAQSRKSGQRIPR